MKYLAFILAFLPLFLFGQSNKVFDVTIGGTRCDIIYRGDTVELECFYVVTFRANNDLSLSIRFLEDEDKEVASWYGVEDFVLDVEFNEYGDCHRTIDICLKGGTLVTIGKGEAWTWTWIKIQDGSTTLVLF